MVCDIYVENPFFSIYKKSRVTDIYYVFVGKVDKEIYTILLRFEKRESLSKDMVKKIKSKYPNDYLKWIDIVKKKIKIKFIQGLICIDDTVNELRKKIFYYLSSPSDSLFILPENQELWMVHKNKSYILGYYYENIHTNEIISISSHLDEKSKLSDESNTPFNNQFNTKINTSMNYFLLKDIIDHYKIDNYTIYLSDAIDEIEYLKSKRIDIQIEKYFKRYWPFVQFNLNMNEIRKKYNFIQKIYENQKKIEELVVDGNNYLESCNIITIQININYNKKDIETQYERDNSEDKIDLYDVFENIRDKIDLNMPFVRYTENIFDTPFSIISKKAIYKNRIDYETLKGWLKLNKDEEKKINGIVVKRFLKDYDEQPRYISIQLNKNKTVQMSLSFYNKNNAGFKDVKEAVQECSSFIEEINKNQKNKIEPPRMDIINHRIQFSPNCNISYIRIMIPLHIPFPFLVKEWIDFSRYFPNYLQPISNEKINEVDKSLRMKYIRVSGYANMIDIIEFIQLLKENNHDDIFILKAIEKKFNKSLEDAKEYLLEWKRKYGIQKSSWIEKNINGIILIIKQDSILISGIKSIYHIPLLYNFIKKFIYLFVKSKENKINLRLNTDFGEKYEKYNKNKWNDYEYNKNATIENIDVDIYDEENKYYEENKYGEYKNYENIENEESYNLYDEENLKNNQLMVIPSKSVEQFINRRNIVGLARDDEITDETKLRCKDALPEKDTCQDFCNDPKYFLRRLQRFDNKLFRKSKDLKNEKDHYPRQCQRSFKQPVILPYNPEDNPKIKRESYTYTMSYSTDPQVFKRWYICPKIWCPYCEIPIYEGDIDPKTIRKKTTIGDRSVCKTAICPYGDHQVFIKEESDGKVYMYPSFLNKTMHPNGFCLPCCALKSSTNPKAASYVKFKKCIGDDVENKNVKDSQVYILGKDIPIEKDRLSYDIAHILNTNLETGYLGNQKGFVRKGIKQEDKNNSFLSSICDLVSCDKQNILDLKKCKQILLEKCTETLFLTLHNGNLKNIFNYPPLTPLENFKNYISSPNVYLDHTYLWDLLQRENILFEEGMNIFIFEKNTLLCPYGYNISQFYNEKRKNILLVKEKIYYEPIYYLEGKNKLSNKVCIFTNQYIEVFKLFKIAMEECKSKYDLDWQMVLKDNIKKYNIPVDNLSYDLGENLYTVITELIEGIQNKKLTKDYIPVMQYMDSYNKVFGLKLKSGLYIPIEPSVLLQNVPFETIHNFNNITKLSFKDTVKMIDTIAEKTKLKLKITHKIIEHRGKEGKGGKGRKGGKDEKGFIIGLLTEKNRIIPIQKMDNTDKKYPVSVMSYYPDVNQSLVQNNINIDKRIYYINRKRFEEENYTRMRFELSKYIKNNKKIYDKIINYIQNKNENLIQNSSVIRSKIYELLDTIFKTIISFNKKELEYSNYSVPNKRVPCHQRRGELSCHSDPHCAMDKKECKLFLNKKNLLDDTIENYYYNLSMISDELLRFNTKRKEILDDRIPSILNREKIQEEEEKYVVIHTQNNEVILNMLDILYHKTSEFKLDTKTIIDEITTKEYDFRKEKYLKFDTKILNELKMENLSIYWEGMIGSKFKYLIEKENVILMLRNLLKVDEEKDIIEEITEKNIRIRIYNYIIENMNGPFIRAMIEKFRIHYNEKWNITDIEMSLLNLYKKCGKRFQYATSLTSILNQYVTSSYDGCIIDIYLFGKIYGYNIIILDKRQRKGDVGYIYFENNYSNKYILLYRTYILDEVQFHIIKWKVKSIFKLNDLPMKFVSKFIKVHHKHKGLSKHKGLLQRG